MKHSNLIASIFTIGLILSGCNSTNNTNSNSANVEIITGVEIYGPTNVTVGKTITLTADVIGSDDDSVTWSTSDEYIATVDSNGIITGVDGGDVTITATSVKDPTKSKSVTVKVTLIKATSIDLFIEDSNNVVYNSTNDTYTVLLGQTFYLNTSYLPLDANKPDITYSFSYADGSDYNSLVSIEVEPDTNRAKIISFLEMDGIVITANGRYSSSTATEFKDSIVVNVVDKNVESYNEVLNKVNSFKDEEKSSLTSSKVVRTKEVTQDNNIIKTVENITHNSYINASYTNKNIKEYVNNNLENEENHKYYQGIQTLNNIEHYYEFEYDSNDNIVKFYENVNQNNALNYSSYTNKLGLMMDIYGSKTYGYSELLNNILGSENNLYEGDIASFGNSYIYAYSQYEINSNSFKVTSNCLDDDYDIEYKVSLEVFFNDTKLISYVFTEEATYENLTIKFTEEGNDFVYSTKTYDNSSNENYLDLTKYLVNDFEVVLFNEKDSLGRYDYSNEDKYGVDFVSEEYGLVKYTASYDKSIVLKVNALTPSTSDVNFDIISCSSANPNQVPSVNTVHDGIFVINSKKDPVTATHYAGKSIFTFTSSLGYQKQVVIEFVEAMLKSVNVTFGDKELEYNSETERYEFDPIFENKNSSYFFINTTPDENKYEFGIEILSGNDNGIELFQYTDDNPFGYPGAAYAIKGLKKGTYTFKVNVKGYEYVKDSKTFEITVEEPYSVEYIAQNIVGKTYTYKGSISSYSFKFESETTLKYIQKDYDTTREKSVNYHIEKGAIVVDSVQKLGNGVYYSKINEGEIIFTKDFSSINISLEMYGTANVDGSALFTYHTFTYEPDPISIDKLMDHINGKTLSNNENTVKVTFNNGKGTLNLYSYENELLATINFDYSYRNNSFVISNSTSTSNFYTLVDDKCGFDAYNQVIEFRINNNTNNYYNTYKVSIF